jgi:hypothetical protein
MQELKGSLVVMMLSPTGLNFKTIVCEDSSQSTISSNVTTTATKCGKFSTVDTPEVTISGSGVLDASPAVNQATLKELQAWALAGTLLYFIRKTLADTAAGETSGESLYLDGRGYLSNVEETSAEGDVIKFSWTLTTTGTVDNTADS